MATCQNVRSILLRSQKDPSFIFKPTAYGVAYSPKVVESTSISVAVFMFSSFQVILIPFRQSPVLVTSTSIMNSISDDVIAINVRKVVEWEDIFMAGGILSLAELIKKCQKDWTVAYTIHSLEFTEYSTFQFMNNLFREFRQQQEPKKEESKNQNKEPSKEIVTLILSDYRPKDVVSIASAIQPGSKETEKILTILEEMKNDGQVVKVQDPELGHEYWRLSRLNFTGIKDEIKDEHGRQIASEIKEKTDNKIADALQWLNKFKQTNPNVKLTEKIESRGEKHSPQFQVTLVVENEKFTSTVWSSKLKMARASAVFEMRNRFSSID